jgi:cyclohexanone monooxygenase
MCREKGLAMSGNNVSTSAGTDQQRAPSAGIDVDFLREKYRAERDRRLRPDMNKQYPELRGALGDFASDPFVDPHFSRPPVNDEIDALVVGGGLGGLLAGAQLREAGVKRIRIIEKGGDFGGVWYWNRYPGAMCDIESYVYMPMLEETGYIPSEKYAHQPEIYEYCRLMGKTYDLYEGALFQTELTGLRWDDAKRRWLADTDRNDRIRAKYVILSIGGLSRLRLPGIPGIEQFQGRMFHTSRWDYAYTGGDTNGGMAKLADKRVGVIGTGATAVQCVPGLGESAAQLIVFQRTPSTVAARNNRPTDPGWAETLTPGWQRRRMTNFVSVCTGGDEPEDLVDDGWTYTMRKLGAGPSFGGSGSGEGRDPETLDMELMEEIRGRIGSIVEDKETAEALKPYYRYLCKRPGFHDSYLQTFNRPNVKLVDTHGHGVDSITPRGVVVDGQEYELDCLIFATGFDLGKGYLNSGAFDVIGREGKHLSELWANGARTFHGMFAAGFPNCFFTGSTQAGVSVNFVHTLWGQAEHIAYVVQAAESASASIVEATPEAEDEWQEAIFGEQNPGALEFFENCTPGYFNNEGNVRSSTGFLAGRYPHGALAYFKMLRDWRDEGSFHGLSIR